MTARWVRGASLLALAIGLWPQAAGAQPGRADGGWEVSAGTVALLRTEWEAGRDEEWLVVPNIEARYGERFFASFGRGVGFDFADAEGWDAGPYVRFAFGRDEEDDPALQGMGDVDASLEPGGYVERTWRYARVSLSARQGIGGHEGQIVEAGADLRLRFGPRVFGGIGPRVRWSSAEYQQVAFGVDAGQAARSGLAPFRPESGIESLGLGASLVAFPTRRIVATAFLQAAELQGDAAESPLVRERGDTSRLTGGVAIAYRLGRRE